MRRVVIVLLVLCFVFPAPSSSLPISDRLGVAAAGAAGEYDVVVVGAEPEGVAAAVAAARAGARVLLLERRGGPGGLYVYGWLNSFDLNYGPHNELLTRGIFEEFFKAVGGTSFDVEQARRLFEQFIGRERNLTAIYNVSGLAPVLSADGAVVAVAAQTAQGQVLFRARAFIDATQDADLAAAAGVPYTFGGEDYGSPEVMAATLVFKLKGVDWAGVSQALKQDGDIHTGADATSAWGFWTEMRRYSPTTPRLRVRGLNLGRQKDGSVLVNALQIFGVNGVDPDSYRKGYELARRELPRIVSFMRRNIRPFARAELAGAAPELYIRETRHMRGEYVLTIDDVLGNRYFPDQIAVASYPVDVQATSPKNFGWAFGKPTMYSIPLRCLVPLGAEDLFVVGRSASYSSLAAGSARVVPVGMATGQAAGVAAAVAAKRGLTPRAIARTPALVKEVQEILKSQGAYLPTFSFSHPVADHWAYPAVRELQRLGLVAAGYKNEYRLEEPMTAASFLNLARVAFRRFAPDLPQPPEKGLRPPQAEPLTLGRAKAILGYFIDWYRPGRARNFSPTHPNLQLLAPTAVMTRAQAYTLLVEALHMVRPAGIVY